jgi:ankyrin repeat protein
MANPKPVRFFDQLVQGVDDEKDEEYQDLSAPDTYLGVAAFRDAVRGVLASNNVALLQGMNPNHLRVLHSEENLLELAVQHNSSECFSFLCTVLEPENRVRHLAYFGRMKELQKIPPPQILATDGKKKNTLRAAIMGRQPDCVRFLLEIGFDPDGPKEDSHLIYLSKQGSDKQGPDKRVELAKILIKFKADVNGRDPDGATALHYGDELMTALLIENGARTSVDDPAGNPLAWALRQRDTDGGTGAKVMALLRHDPDLATFKTLGQGLESSQGKTIPIYDSIMMKKNIEIMLGISLERIISKPDGAHFLHFMALTGTSYKKFWSRAILHDPNLLVHQTADGQTPFHIAIQQQNEPFVRFLIDRGASLGLLPHINGLKDSRGATPLRCAVAEELFRVAKILYRSGAECANVPEVLRLFMTDDRVEPEARRQFRDLHEYMMSTLCTVCKAHIGKRCGTCRKVRVCDTECQAKIWEAHKEACRESAEQRKALEKPLKLLGEIIQEEHKARKCGGCGACASKKRCSRCLSTFYCNAECQTAHWSTHRRDCSER